MLHRLSHPTDYGTSAQMCFCCQQIRWAGAPRTRLHPVWHATLPDTRYPSTALPNPFPCAHAAAASAAALLEEDADDLGHRSQARRCRRAGQIIVARSLVSVVDAGDDADAGGVQRRTRQSENMLTEESMACGDAASAPSSSSASFSGVGHYYLKRIFVIKTILTIIKNRSF